MRKVGGQVSAVRVFPARVLAYRARILQRGAIALSAQIKVGNTVIHRIVEQEAPFFPAFQFFPTLSKELYEAN